MRAIQVDLSRQLKLLPQPSMFESLMVITPQHPAGAHSLAQWLQHQPAMQERVLDLYSQQAWIAGGAQSAPEVFTLDKVLHGHIPRLHTCTIMACIESVYPRVPQAKAHLLTRLSLRTAHVASALAGLIGISPDEAFLAGALHAVGERVLHATLPDAMSVLDQDVSVDHLQRPEVQRNFWGFDYADAGGALLSQWRLPSFCVEAVAMQLEPLEAQQHQMLGAVVSLASWRVRVELSGRQLRDMAVSYPQQVAVLLGLDNDILLGEMPLNGDQVAASSSSCGQRVAHA